MKKSTLAYKAEKLGYTVLFSSVISDLGVEETKTEILKERVNILKLSSNSKWIINNDTVGFAKLSENEQDALMEIVMEFMATPKRDR